MSSCLNTSPSGTVVAILFGLVLQLICLPLHVVGSEETKIIDEGEWGDWQGWEGVDDKLYKGFFVCGADLRYDDTKGGGWKNDKTAANGLRLTYCHEDHWENQIYDFLVEEGMTGEWKGMIMCPVDFYVDGGAVRFDDPPNGNSGNTGKDETALNGLSIHCRHKETAEETDVLVWEGDKGAWKKQVVVSDKFVQMANVRLQQGGDDETALNGLMFGYESPSFVIPGSEDGGGSVPEEDDEDRVPAGGEDQVREEGEGSFPEEDEDRVPVGEEDGPAREEDEGSLQEEDGEDHVQADDDDPAVGEEPEPISGNDRDEAASNGAFSNAVTTYGEIILAVAIAVPILLLCCILALLMICWRRTKPASNNPPKAIPEAFVTATPSAPERGDDKAFYPETLVVASVVVASTSTAPSAPDAVDEETGIQSSAVAPPPPQLTSNPASDQYHDSAPSLASYEISNKLSHGRIGKSSTRLSKFSSGRRSTSVGAIAVGPTAPTEATSVITTATSSESSQRREKIRSSRNSWLSKH